ncbi:MAG: hypothetical protein Q9222_001386 [Ikaeria aurantiellina]
MPNLRASRIAKPQVPGSENAPQMPIIIHFMSDEKFRVFMWKLQFHDSAAQVLFEQYIHDAQAGIRSVLKSQGAWGNIESRMKDSWKKQEHIHVFKYYPVGPSLQYVQTVERPSVSENTPYQSSLPSWLTAVQSDITRQQPMTFAQSNSSSVITSLGNAATASPVNPTLNITSTAVNHIYPSSRVSEVSQPDFILPCRACRPIPITPPPGRPEQHLFNSSAIGSPESRSASSLSSTKTSPAEQPEPLFIIPRRGNASLNIQVPPIESNTHHSTGASKGSDMRMVSTNSLSRKAARHQRRGTQDGRRSGSTPAKADSSMTVSRVGDSTEDDTESPRKLADEDGAGARPLEATLADRPVDQLGLPRTRAKVNSGNPAPVTPTKLQDGYSASATATPNGSGETVIRKTPSHRIGSNVTGSDYRNPSRKPSSIYDQPLATFSPVKSHSQRRRRQGYTDGTAESLADSDTTSSTVKPAHVRQYLSYADSVKGLQQSQPQRRSEVEDSIAEQEKIVKDIFPVGQSECNGLNGELPSPSTHNGSLTPQDSAGAQSPMTTKTTELTKVTQPSSTPTIEGRFPPRAHRTPPESEDGAPPPALPRRPPSLTVLPPATRHASPPSLKISDTLCGQRLRLQKQGTTLPGLPDPFITSPGENRHPSAGHINVGPSIPRLATDSQGPRSAHLLEQREHDLPTPTSDSAPSSSGVPSTNLTPPSSTPADTPDKDFTETEDSLFAPDGPLNECQRNLYLHNPHRSRFAITQAYNAHMHSLPLHLRSRRPNWGLDPRTRYDGLDPQRFPKLEGRAAARAEAFAQAAYGTTLDGARNLGPVPRRREGDGSGPARL